jgi:predicted MFS family arabinose efflux permease
MSAAIVGALLGPVLGGVAAEVGRAPTFGAIAGVSLLLAVVALLIVAPPPEARQPLRTMFVALRERPVLGGMWLLWVPALLFGMLSVLGPLRLDALGWGALGVTATFVVAAAFEAAVSPLVGRWSDRSGRLAPIRVGLVLSIAVSLSLPWIGERLALSAFVVLAGISYGMFWAPAMAMLSDSWEAAGVGHALGFALMNLAWAPGNVIGSAAGGALADLAGDVASYAVAAALCLGTLVGIRILLSARTNRLLPLRPG